MGTEQAWWQHHLGPRELSFGSSFDLIYLCDLGKAIWDLFIKKNKQTIKPLFF